MSLVRRITTFVLILLVAHGVHALQGVINVGMIPDAGATQASIQEKEPLKVYLTQALGHEVNLVIPANYNAIVEGLGNGSLDFAMLGGLTYVKAHARYGVVPLVQRAIDQKFHTLFIANTGSSIQTLRDLKGKRFAFGDVSSTSGHLIPYIEIRQAGVDPDHDLEFRYTGSHTATAKAVEMGEVDAGALDETVYKSMVSDGSLNAAKVRVFHTSKPFVDNVWVARKEVNPVIREKFAQAFTALKESQNEEVLKILRAKDFVRASNEEYTIIRLFAQQLSLL